MIPVTKNLFRIDPTEAQEQKRQKNKQTKVESLKTGVDEGLKEKSPKAKDAMTEAKDAMTDPRIKTILKREKIIENLNLKVVQKEVIKQPNQDKSLMAILRRERKDAVWV